MKLWSISTTIRNPDRLREFLKVLSVLENKIFDKETQCKYQILLIQNHLYLPNNIPSDCIKYYEDYELNMPFEVAEKIFWAQKYKDPPMRGRQSVNPLNKLGFSIARNKEGPIKITPLGKAFIEESVDISYIFQKSLLKLQFPNLWSNDFSITDGFDIKPLIGTINFINKVNIRYGNEGITKSEFCLFIPSLINYNIIDNQVNQIEKYRKSQNKVLFFTEYAKNFYKVTDLSDKLKNNFFEYGDNIMRYFRITKLFKVTTSNINSDWRINFEPTRQEEINYIIKNYNSKAKTFGNSNEYYNYLYDINIPRLLIDDHKNLDNIIYSIRKNINLLLDNNPDLIFNNYLFINQDIGLLTNTNKHEFIEELRTIYRELNIKLRENDSNKLYRLNEIIDILSDIKSKKIKPEKFEEIIYDSLKILDDELQIKPNYLTDDNGRAITHASGNKPDIECYYTCFNKICEVTLESTNRQWIMETQPVMRHLRNFENNSTKEINYCLFIAPRIHIDTAYHFWLSAKYGYDNETQKIIPINVKQFCVILKILYKYLKNNKKWSHLYLKKLYDKIMIEADLVKGHTEWINSIEDIILEWGKEFDIC